MSFELKEPILVVGLGGVGSKLAARVGRSLNSDCLLISNDAADLEGGKSIRIDTSSIVNPSYQTIRGFALESSDDIREGISQYSTVVMMANLAGKAGSAIAPIVSSICRQESKSIVSFAVMPFGYESDRIFASGVALKRVKADSACTVIVDNDAMLQSNPDLTAGSCYDIANSAIVHMAGSIRSEQMPSEANILCASRDGLDTEDSLRDSIKMLYQDAPQSSVRGSIIHVLGGDSVPVGMMRTISSLTLGAIGESTSVGISPAESETSSIVMLAAVQGQTKFDGYDPLGAIPSEDTIDWDTPDCSYDCKLEMYQLE